MKGKLSVILLIASLPGLGAHLARSTRSRGPDDALTAEIAALQESVAQFDSVAKPPPAPAPATRSASLRKTSPPQGAKRMALSSKHRQRHNATATADNRTAKLEAEEKALRAQLADELERHEEEKAALEHEMAEKQGNASAEEAKLQATISDQKAKIAALQADKQTLFETARNVLQTAKATEKSRQLELDKLAAQQLEEAKRKWQRGVADARAAEVASLQHNASALERKVSKALRAAEKRALASQAEADSLRDNVTDLSRLLEQEHTANQVLKRQAEALKLERDGEAAKHQSERALENIIVQEKDKIASMDAEKQDLLRTIHSMVEKESGNQTHEQELQAAKDAAEENLASLKNSLEARAKKAEAAVAVKEDAIGVLAANIESLKAANKELAIANAALNQSRSTAEQVLSNQSAQLKDAMATAEKEAESVAMLNASLSDARMNEASLREQIEEGAKGQEEQRKKLQRLLDTANGLKNLAEQARSDKAKLASDAAAKERNISREEADLRAQVHNDTVKIASLQAEVGDFVSEEAKFTAAMRQKAEEESSLKKTEKQLQATVQRDAQQISNGTRNLHLLLDTADGLRNVAAKFREAKEAVQKEKAAEEQAFAKEKASLQSRIDSLAAEVRDVGELRANLSRSLRGQATVEAQLRDRQAQNAAFVKENVELKAEVQEAEGKIKAQAEALRGLEAQSAKTGGLEVRISEMEARYELQAKQQLQLEDQLSNAQAKVNAEAAEVQALRAQKDNATALALSRQEVLAARLKESEARNDALRAALEEARSGSEAVRQAEISREKQEVTDAQNRAMFEAEAVKTLQSTLAAQQQEAAASARQQAEAIRALRQEDESLRRALTEARAHGDAVALAKAAEQQEQQRAAQEAQALSASEQELRAKGAADAGPGPEGQPAEAAPAKEPAPSAAAALSQADDSTEEFARLSSELSQRLRSQEAEAPPADATSSDAQAGQEQEQGDEDAAASA